MTAHRVARPHHTCTGTWGENAVGVVKVSVGLSTLALHSKQWVIVREWPTKDKTINRQMWALRKYLENSNGSHLNRQQRRSAVEHSCHLWVVRTESLRPDLRRPLIQRLCLRVLSLQRDYVPQCQLRSQNAPCHGNHQTRSFREQFFSLSPDSSTTSPGCLAQLPLLRGQDRELSPKSPSPAYTEDLPPRAFPAT